VSDSAVTVAQAILSYSNIRAVPPSTEGLLDTLGAEIGTTPLASHCRQTSREDSVAAWGGGAIRPRTMPRTARDDIPRSLASIRTVALTQYPASRRGVTRITSDFGRSIRRLDDCVAHILVPGRTLEVSAGE